MEIKNRCCRWTVMSNGSIQALHVKQESGPTVLIHIIYRSKLSPVFLLSKGYRKSMGWEGKILS